MARNKLASGSRKLLSAKRDGNRDEFSAPNLELVAESSETPSHALSMLELVHKAREQLTEEERAIADLRGQGKIMGSNRSTAGWQCPVPPHATLASLRPSHPNTRNPPRLSVSYVPHHVSDLLR